METESSLETLFYAWNRTMGDVQKLNNCTVNMITILDIPIALIYFTFNKNFPKLSTFWLPVTVAERSEACTVFARSEAGIVGSDPT
jgi:hypothetical protein